MPNPFLLHLLHLLLHLLLHPLLLLLLLLLLLSPPLLKLKLRRHSLPKTGRAHSVTN